MSVINFSITMIKLLSKLVIITEVCKADWVLDNYTIFVITSANVDQFSKFLH